MEIAIGKPIVKPISVEKKNKKKSETTRNRGRKRRHGSMKKIARMFSGIKKKSHKGDTVAVGKRVNKEHGLVRAIPTLVVADEDVAVTESQESDLGDSEYPGGNQVRTEVQEHSLGCVNASDYPHGDHATTEMEGHDLGGYHHGREQNCLNVSDYPENAETENLYAGDYPGGYEHARTQREEYSYPEHRHHVTFDTGSNHCLDTTDYPGGYHDVMPGTEECNVAIDYPEGYYGTENHYFTSEYPVAQEHNSSDYPTPGGYYDTAIPEREFHEYSDQYHYHEPNLEMNYHPGGHNAITESRRDTNDYPCVPTEAQEYGTGTGILKPASDLNRSPHASRVHNLYDVGEYTATDDDMWQNAHYWGTQWADNNYYPYNQSNDNPLNWSTQAEFDATNDNQTENVAGQNGEDNNSNSSGDKHNDPSDHGGGSNGKGASRSDGEQNNAGPQEEIGSSLGSSRSSCIIRVTLQGCVGYPLGFEVEGGSDTPLKYICIHSLLPNTPASECGCFTAGDQLVMIGEACLIGVTLKEAQYILKKAPETVHVVAQRKHPAALDIPPAQGKATRKWKPESQTLDQYATYPDHLVPPPSTFPPYIEVTPTAYTEELPPAPEPLPSLPSFTSHSRLSIGSSSYNLPGTKMAVEMRCGPGEIFGIVIIGGRDDPYLKNVHVRQPHYVAPVFNYSGTSDIGPSKKRTTGHSTMSQKQQLPL
jgi:hypothetical protein